MSINYRNNTEEVIRRLMKAIEEGGQELGVTLTADVQANVPVDTGKLQKSYTFEKKVRPRGIRITEGTSVIYAPHLELKPQNNGGRPHLVPTIRNNKSRYIEILKKHLKGV